MKTVVKDFMLKLYKVFFLMLIAICGTTVNAAKKKEITMYVGSVKTIEVGSVIRVAVGIDKLVGTTVMENGNMLLIAKQAGQTELHIWKKGERKLTYNIKILPGNIGAQLNKIRQIFRSHSKIRFRAVEDVILAEGTIAIDKMEQFTAMLTKFPSVMSFVTPEKVDVRDMVTIEVKLLEINKNFTKQIGINWDNAINGPAFGYVKNFKPTQYVYANDGNPFLELFEGDPPLLSNSDSNSYTYGGVLTGITSMINLLKEDGIARVLAEPTLSTRSGEIASFHSGGQFPIAVLNEVGQPVVQMQDYGIQLNIEPITDEYGNIVSNIRAEMSTIDQSVVVNGIPGLLTRNAESVVNLKSGETMVISGLVKTNDSKAYERVPLLGDIPILGELFTSRNFVEGRSELLIMVTPRISNERQQLPEKVKKQLIELQKIRKDTAYETGILD